MIVLLFSRSGVLLALELFYLDSVESKVRFVSQSKKIGSCTISLFTRRTVFKGVSFLMRQRVETEIPASLTASFIVSKRVILGHPDCIAYNVVNIMCWRLSLLVSNCLYLLALFFRKMSSHYTLIPIVFHI